MPCCRWCKSDVQVPVNFGLVSGENHRVEDGRPAGEGLTLRYLGMVEIGEWFEVSHRTVALWRRRYVADHPFPEPDVVIGRTPGWSPARESEIRAWERARPGQGAGGGRPRKTT